MVSGNWNGNNNPDGWYMSTGTRASYWVLKPLDIYNHIAARYIEVIWLEIGHILHKLELGSLNILIILNRTVNQVLVASRFCRRKLYRI